VRVRVRLFASLRDVAGEPVAELQLPAGATAEDAWRALVKRHPALAGRRPSLAAAVNRSYREFDAVLQEDDELAFIPPVSGG
jgi:molybdopterin synthase catalytic subunit